MPRVSLNASLFGVLLVLPLAASSVRPGSLDGRTAAAATDGGPGTFAPQPPQRRGESLPRASTIANLLQLSRKIIW